MLSISPDEKQALRRELRRRRSLLSKSYRQFSALRLVGLAGRAGLWRRGRLWAFYQPFGFELDCQVLRRVAMQRAKQVLLPVVLHVARRTMRFVRVQENDPWRVAGLGMQEPLTRGRVPLSRIDVVFLPLIGFDRAGGRLGQGGGFYDTALAFRRRAAAAKPLLVGLAYACQELAEIPMQAWDVRLDWVLTEREAINCRRWRALLVNEV